VRCRIRLPASLLAWIAWRFGVTEVARSLLVSSGRFVVVFHGISGRRSSDIPSQIQPYLTADELRLTLGWLQSRFPFLNPSEFLDSAKNGILLTFDDGQANNHTRALPILEEFSAPAVFFVSTQHVLRPRDWLPVARSLARSRWGKEELVPEQLAVEFFDGMSQVQLTECARHPLITLGSHTVSHPCLTRCGRPRLGFELAESKRVLETLTGRSIDLLAYPSGDYDREVAQVATSFGYRAAFALDPKGLGLPAYEIPRIGLYAADCAYLSFKFSGLHRPPLRGDLAVAASRNRHEA